MKYIPEDQYHVQDIFVAPDGTWHKNGVAIAPHHALSHVDVIWNALQGNHEEHAKVQNILETHRVPFTGSGAFASVVGMNDKLMKEMLMREKIKTPPYKVVDAPKIPFSQEDIVALWRTFSPPVVLKTLGPSPSIILAKTFSGFTEALEQAYEKSDAVMIEEYIPGSFASVGVIDGYRGSKQYALPAIGDTLSLDRKKEIEEIARRVHEALGFRHYSQIDFIVAPRRGAFVIGAAPLPDLYEESLFHRALHSVGAPIEHFLDHVVQLALAKK